MLKSDVGNSKEGADDLGRQTTMIDRKSATEIHVQRDVHFGTFHVREGKRNSRRAEKDGNRDYWDQRERRSIVAAAAMSISGGERRVCTCA